MLVLHYPRCSTCKKALKWLDEHNIKYEARDIVKDNPTSEELKKWHQQSQLPIKRFFNTSGKLYREQKLKDKLEDMTTEEKYEILSTNGMLVKRPIVVSKNAVLTGFKEKEWEEKLL